MKCIFTYCCYKYQQKVMLTDSLNSERTESPMTLDFSFQACIKGTRAVAHHEHVESKQERLKMNATYVPLTWSHILWECWLFIKMKSKLWIWRRSVNTTKREQVGGSPCRSLQCEDGTGCFLHTSANLIQLAHTAMKRNRALG